VQPKTTLRLQGEGGQPGTDNGQGANGLGAHATWEETVQSGTRADELEGADDAAPWTARPRRRVRAAERWCLAKSMADAMCRSRGGEVRSGQTQGGAGDQRTVVDLHHGGVKDG
jgi:hypothetical protein